MNSSTPRKRKKKPGENSPLPSKMSLAPLRQFVQEAAQTFEVIRGKCVCVSVRVHYLQKEATTRWKRWNESEAQDKRMCTLGLALLVRRRLAVGSTRFETHRFRGGATNDAIVGSSRRRAIAARTYLLERKFRGFRCASSIRSDGRK